MAACPSCGQENPDGFRFCGACGAPLAAEAGAGVRKTVTVLFCDVTGSTALGESVDPEALRGLLARYFERMRAIVERHGGTVEKFIGDAVMAVFGVPVAHEDDALRAVRAAAEMRDALPELGIRARIGVNTGEVVAGTEERLATGDAVNVAARLEQAAASGEILLGEATLELVRAAVEVEAVEPLALKGKAEPVQAYRLVRASEAPERRHETRFVGRAGELELVRQAWQRAAAERRCELVTIVADAGVGKSRLAAEALGAVAEPVVRGRCPSYGEGSTFWPVVEVLRQLGIRPGDKAVAAAIGSLLGESDAPASADELAWAVRKTLEQAATEHPLAVVLDDIQWGEETFLDLVEHVALLSVGAPILLVCLGRPELLERRPQWPVTMRLEPLPPAEVDQLVPRELDAELRDRIARAAGGNPLFVIEMLALARGTEADVAVPPTLQALLAARLDQLEPSERTVLERAAVEGEVFHRGAVQALVADELQVTPRLAALVRRELITPHEPQLPRDDGFRFRHLLMRDAAYHALAKATRARLHEQLARWLEEHAAGLVELDEILGHHLERAVRYRRELGLPEDDGLAEGARRRLTNAGVRARVRGDDPAAVNLFERALTLGRDDELDLALELDLIDGLYWAGRADDSLEAARSLAERAAAARNRPGELCAQIKEAQFRIQLEPEGATERLAALLEASLPELEAGDDDVPLYTAYHALGYVRNVHAQYDALLDAFERAAAYAQRAGRPYEFLPWRLVGSFYGSTPASAVLAWVDAQQAGGTRHHRLDGYRALALALLGRVDEARTVLGELRARRGEGGIPRTVLGISMELELLAGDFPAAVDLGRQAAARAEQLGDRASGSTVAARLARALAELERLDEAEEWADRAAELGASDDWLTQLLWRQAKAKVLAHRGEHAEAQRLAREAVAIAAETDFLDGQADAYATLGDVLALAGDHDEAAGAFAEALARYERKENLVMARRLRERLAQSTAI